MIHVRKVHPEYFEALRNGSKTFEVRKEEPDAPEFAVGDFLALNEYDPGRHTIPGDNYTGRCLMFRITYVLRGFDGLVESYVCLGLNAWHLELAFIEP